MKKNNLFHFILIFLQQILRPRLPFQSGISGLFQALFSKPSLPLITLASRASLIVFNIRGHSSPPRLHPAPLQRTNCSQEIPASLSLLRCRLYLASSLKQHRFKHRFPLLCISATIFRTIPTSAHSLTNNSLASVLHPLQPHSTPNIHTQDPHSLTWESRNVMPTPLDLGPPDL